ncbi:hypothetical protein [Methylobacterium sp. SyP6R]|uniref:hypothetical protein n=1 Tax=Methylobacterium sp. SyP6R TaxID=2718876 RepID=UPI001F33C04F|nr:hypothetical protein [Methylobacterium sp. SyP6R]MCF4124961.1 hypothetical protein [Methylobacterium sp. SyP6R]
MNEGETPGIRHCKVDLFFRCPFCRLEHDMPVWNNCTMSSYYDDGLIEEQCVVKIEGSSIIIEYMNGKNRYSFVGVEQTDGHYKLTAQTHKGRATLHRFPNDQFLEGWWHEDGRVGMWRIQLDD